MTDANRRLNLTVETEKGEASLRAADLCLQARLYDDAVSRAYYGAFHFVQALLLSEGLESKTHAGAHDLFYLHFVRGGRITRHVAKLFSGLQRYREQADYMRAFQFDEADARDELGNARLIRDAVATVLRAAGWIS